jgi:tetratricopeptide (TPR) repeat protein
MKKIKWLMLISLVAMLAAPGCKKGVESASEPIKKQAEDHYTKARRLFLTCDPDKYPEAIKEYQLALNLWDEYPEALAGLAEAISMWRGFSLSEKEFGDAYQYAQRALRLNPELAAGYRAMADLSRHRKDFDRATRQIDMAVKIEPQNAENLYVKGSSLLASNPQEAYQVLLSAQKANPDLAKIYFNLASAAQKLGRFDEAISFLTKYQELVPSDISATCSLAMIKLAKRDKEKTDDAKAQLDKDAVELFKLTLAKSDTAKKPWQIPWVLLSYKTLAKMDAEQKKYPEAIEYFKKAEGVFPTDFELQFLMGVTYKNMGDKKSANEHLQKALDVAPDNEQVKKALKEL